MTIHPDSSKLIVRFRVEGMDCASCASKIDTALRRLPGIEEVAVSVPGASLSISHDGTVSKNQVMQRVRHLGFGIAPAEPMSQNHASHVADQPWWRTRKALLTISCGMALISAFLIGQLIPEAAYWAFLIAMLVGLVPVARRAFVAATLGSPFSIETLMTVAAVGAVLIGATEEAAVVVFLFLVGEMLEGVAAERARASIAGLADLIPKTAYLEQGNTISEVPADRLSVGDVIVVRPGDRIAADGEITEGSSEINEAPVTGESVPRRKSQGDTVYAGTISLDGVLRIRVTAAADDNTIARVVRLVEEAQSSKAPTERFIDRFSRYYTPGVLVLGALIATVPPVFAGADWSEWIYKGLAILLIGCPCALVISTPAAVAAGLASGARRGLLMKGGAVLEGFSAITAVAFDKTGTLTEGRPVVTDIRSFGSSDQRLLSLAAALEQGSNHPLALAVLQKAASENAPIPPASEARAVTGKGVEGRVGGVPVFLGSATAARDRVSMTENQIAVVDAFNAEGKTVSVLLVDNKVSALFAMRDEPRTDAIDGLASLKTKGIRTLMLTGDNTRTATAIADTLGIEPRADLLPQDKQRVVNELRADGLKVAKVGDGINDAPALAAADIGIAMGGGTDVALETADAAILHGRVMDVAKMINLSHAVMRNIKLNVGMALGLKTLFLVTTVLGVTGLWPAILADTGATVLVTANAMRLLAWKGET
ncbi:Lead, cadmium, zinc and mercury-transporting ATPase (plasmid) [Labrenzia sp. THAF191b]|uniref:P-type Zn(2+) transporter n=2 Tax=Roseibium alexandrii TaxID=388408 RepID=A0A5E8H7P2_ROSAD|nr:MULTISPECIES: heavy metal translocating P-type ATPase [unclassified Labrenzia]EEE48109.2 copper-, silver- or heavy metal-(Cd/Co/Hg/Pb/Zn)-translocating P-type ATPase [Roseibium alexandrii DFL-11]QFT01953.1 Lead, cadmium, zinc and mercury-transporting ATPase [Labrenzia sp. THAF191b]QFT02036.1 Lead, cadmium, zinc and mercury-transporting ATPase [Labrenzia sp. THAF191b]QFT07760.1 Lead, cadmium, zinc and mercury-transporting ATPase [Labrenzia sp. THAF191a]QFT08338.1 Lead, cadmium, zinc and merc